MGHRERPRRPHGDPSRLGHPRGLSLSGWPKPWPAVSTWPSIWLSRPLRTTPGSKSTPNGSGTDLTARIRYAENPPKRYEDIYPFDFASPDWSALWLALLDVVFFWIKQGVTVFRVDNPHTKPFAFWEWLISSVRARSPEVIFLSEAFTRPRIMEELARIGFTQSYTYFTWRTSKWELETYLTELTRTERADYFRPNLWPNTPDILSEELQTGGRPAFIARLVLAATLSSNYGIYGPAFELQEHLPRGNGSEEYLRSEKYEVRSWDLERPDQSLCIHRFGEQDPP